MMLDLNEPTRIYHFTHAKNLPKILDAGYLYCKARLPADLEVVDISHQSVQEKRRNKRVRCEPGGILHDYVPFHFATRSPMMFAIHKGNVEGRSSDMTPLIYVVSSVQRVQEMGLKFVFSDGHPTKAFSEIYNDPIRLDKVDWNIMEARYWSDTGEDPDKSRRRQAEFLVHGAFPWEAVESLAVKNAEVKRRLDKFLVEKWPNCVKPVRVASGWYFP